MKLIFHMKVPHKLLLLYLIGMVKHSQSSQNIKLAMSLQYFQKQVRDEVDFFHANKYQMSYKFVSTLWV